MRQRGQTSARSRGRGEEYEVRLTSDVEVTTAARHRHQVVVTQDAALFEQRVEQYHHHQTKQREDELIMKVDELVQNVRDAIQQLQLVGQRVSVSAIT
jgi:hypothetical protein